MKDFLPLSLLFLSYNILCSNSYDLAEQSKLEHHENVRYFAFTKDDQFKHVDIREANCSGNFTTTFIVHGYFKISLKEPLLLKDDIFKNNPDVGCVIVVSWLSYSMYSDKSGFEDKSTNYHIISKSHVPRLAHDINEKLQYIHDKGAGKIELIGHSIGSHVVGQAARYFRKYTGHEVDRIVGLDPAAPFFKDNPHLTLKSTDAKDVQFVHTNIDRYGLGNETGTNHIFVNGGGKQPECKLKLTDNICSHNRGWNVYSEFLKNVSTNHGTSERLFSNRFVLCLDVSASMLDADRLTRAVSAAKQQILDFRFGSFVGLVTFSSEGYVAHSIIEIQYDSDRESLISALPNVALTSTSIGNGLLVSMEMLQNLPQTNEPCPTIILLSDGEQNDGKTPEEVLPLLQNACIRINSVAMGAQASSELENLSAKTNGDVIFIMENDNAQQIVDTERAFSFSYENEIDSDIRSIYLPTQLAIVGSDETYIKCVIDNTIGKDTVFSFTSGDIEYFDVKLISPSGKTYTSNSPEYYDNSANMQKIYKIPLADSGNWNFVVKKNLFKTKRSIRSTFNAIVTIKTHQLDDQVPSIRLDASVSKRTLEYPKSNKQSDVDEARIIIYGELRRGRHAIINADVHAHIQGQNEEPITFQLRDDGSFPDDLANDGVYTGSIVKLKQIQRYSVFVTATNRNDTAKLVPEEIDYFERQSIDCDRIGCEKLSEFERETYVGSVKLISNEYEDRIPPNPITDLRATVLNETERLITLEWTSPDDQVFDIHVKDYDIRLLNDGQDFETAFRLNDSHVVEKSASQRKEKYSIRIPEPMWQYNKKFDEPGFFMELKFAVKAIGVNDRVGFVSNLVSIVLKERSAVLFNSPKICKTIYSRFGGVYIKFC